MLAYELTPDAEADLEAIAEYTLRRWGAEQQAHYGDLRPRSQRRPLCLDDDPKNERFDIGRGCIKGTTSPSFAIYFSMTMA